MGFLKSGTANYYDCDMNNRLKISAAMRYMQQTSSEHLDSIGMSVIKLYEEHMVFLLTKMCVKVHRMPFAAEPLILGTAATEVKGPRFFREFTIDSPDGERLVSALSLWVLVDPESRKILRPSSFPYQLPFVPSIINGAISDIKLTRPSEDVETYVKSIGVGYSHIDTNDHVNNSFYADFVCDALPYDKLIEYGIDTFVVSFQNEAKHGDIIEMAISAVGEKEYHIRAMHENSACFEAYAVLG